MKKKIFKKANLIAAAEPFIEAWLADQGVKASGELINNLISKLTGIGRDVKRQSEDPGKSGEFQREKVFSALANQFDTMGVGAPYNNSEQLFAMFGEKAPEIFGDPNNYLPLINQLKEFLNAASYLRKSDPNLPTESVQYMFRLLEKSGFDIKYTQQKLEDLAQKAASPFSDGYIISVLKNNYSLASVFLMMQAAVENGQFDSSTFKDLSRLTDESNQMLGTYSAEFTNALALSTAISKANFEKILKDRNVYQAMIPTAEAAQEARQKIMRTFGNFYNSSAFQTIIQDPLVKTLILAPRVFKQGIEGASSPSFGEAFDNKVG